LRGKALESGNLRLGGKEGRKGGRHGQNPQAYAEQLASIHVHTTQVRTLKGRTGSRTLWFVEDAGKKHDATPPRRAAAATVDPRAPRARRSMLPATVMKKRRKER
jgi:hypothetical protein